MTAEIALHSGTYSRRESIPLLIPDWRLVQGLIKNKFRFETSPFRGIIEHGRGVTSSALFRPAWPVAD